MEQIIITGLAVLSGLLLVILITVLAARRGKSVSPGAVFESISHRLDELSRMQEKLTDFEGFFRAPQLRGRLGETMLEELLKSVLPRGSYRFQHRFPDGVQVDALVKIGPRYIPIDAKFPLDAFRPFWQGARGGEDRLPSELRRKLKELTAEIAKKYIQPRERTFPFALMYIPSEAVFYEGFVRAEGSDDLFSAALRKHVIPVSPSGLFIYLETLLCGMKSYEIDRNYDRLILAIEQLTRDLTRFSGGFATARTHLRNLSRSFDETARDLERLEHTAGRLAGGGLLREDTDQES